MGFSGTLEDITCIAPEKLGAVGGNAVKALLPCFQVRGENHSGQADTHFRVRRSDRRDRCRAWA